MYEHLDDWWEEAECSRLTTNEERDMFFSEAERATITAQTICSTCSVVEPCLTYALETRQTFGVWGMHTPDDRRNLRRFMSRDPHLVGHHWNFSFAKILAGLESALDAETSERPTVAAV